MDKLTELKQKRANYIDLAQAINDTATDEGRDVSDEELKQIKAYLDNGETLKAEIEALEKSIAEKEALDKRLKADVDALNKSKGSKTTTTGTVQVGKDNILDDPQKGFESHKHFFMELMDSIKRKEVTHDGLKILAAAGADEQSTVADPFGGFLVPVGFVNTLLKRENEPDPTLGRTMALPMGNPTVKIPARVDEDHSTSVSGGLRVFRKPETESTTASRMQISQVVLTASMLTGVTHVTEELMQDSPQSVAAIIEDGFGDEFRAEMLDEKLNGNGVGEFTGVINAPATISIAKEGGQGADTLLFENFLKMRARVWGYKTAIWMANHDIMEQLGRVKVDTGSGEQPLLLPSLKEDVPDVFMGRPIFFSEFMPTVGDTGDIMAINWSQYLDGTYQPLRSAESIHVRFLEHENTFKFWMRNDAAPWWKAALTPRNGSTLSPFVKLDARA